MDFKWLLNDFMQDMETVRYKSVNGLAQYAMDHAPSPIKLMRYYEMYLKGGEFLRLDDVPADNDRNFEAFASNFDNIFSVIGFVHDGKLHMYPHEIAESPRDYKEQCKYALLVADIVALKFAGIVQGHEKQVQIEPIGLDQTEGEIPMIAWQLGYTYRTQPRVETG